ncbi:aminopeptidase N [Aestuariibius sp. HNIBRBA575]|uniref:aminopeptidase N n=1 Tax=Aestuariibius sp. HNIBRBA575 TaxID=3233343 RepID=UPI0034A315CD
MNVDAPQKIYLSDYTPPAYLVEDVHLTFQLSKTATRVISKIRFVPNPAAVSRDFFLHGLELSLISAAIDGKAITPDLSADGLRCDVPDAPFTFEAIVEINPAANTVLEGLYMSGGMYSTQCEAEGFRRITYYPDRPDVMSVFTVRIESDAPVLLSNGNPVAAGDGWAEWHDPWPKPAYLFALVAGDLVNYPGQFTTRSGRDVELNIWVRPGDQDKCAWGMEALKKSMTWDEEVYGREYDLDLFNIVAVDDFNGGAMENKGLNLFNSALVLASPQTATDKDFERIEAVIAHEYFHNWTGNRITCRDWFQLCLKEGLTVFRDQQFTGDMRSAPVKRIEDAILLRSRQFREDNGPLAHPVRPESFVEINNFYTITVYEKGAELIRMLKTLVGDANYEKALNLYFDRHDGDAATIEDWLAVFEDATGRDLSQFKRWYAQAGTPQIHVTDSFNNGTYQLHFKQEIPDTNGQANKAPHVVPIAVGLLGPDGTETHKTTICELTEPEQSFEFDGLQDRPIPSILRDFSAPVILKRNTSPEERAFLLAHDTDPFNKWDAGRALAVDVLRDMVTTNASPNSAFIEGLRSVLRDPQLDPAYQALVLALPSQEDTAQDLHANGYVPDPQAIYDAHETLKLHIAENLQDTLVRVQADCTITGPYSPDAADAGKRALGNQVLSYLSKIDAGKAATAQFETSDNMTQQQAALTCLLSIGKGQDALDAFQQQWQQERLVMDKWFSLQVICAAPDQTAATALSLTKHADFDLKNPNRVRSVFGAMISNPAGFHHKSGAGYALLADQLILLDALNPPVAARISTGFETWKRYDDGRKALIQEALSRIAAKDNLSRDLAEMVGRMLG